MSITDHPLTPRPASIGQKRRLVTEIPGPNSVELQERRANAVTSAVASTLPIYAADAAGGIIVDVDGNQLIDFASGIGVGIVGNSHPKVIEAVSEQVRRFTHTAFMVAPYEQYVAVAERMNELTPGDFAKRTALFNSGSEAVENAVKVARKATGRQEVVVLEHAYHGRTNLTLAMTAKASPFKLGFGPLASGVNRVPGSYPFRDGLDADAALKRIRETIQSRVGETEVAAIVLEPLQGEGGFIVPAPGFLSALQAYARSTGILLIVDEVQSGFGRTGRWFASEWDGLEPDVVVIGKGVGGGLPLSAVTGRAELMDAVQPGGLGGTYGGNPLACAASLAAIRAIESENLLEAALAIGEQVRKRFEPLTEGADAIVGEVRGRGAMMALEFVQPGSIEPAPELAKAIAARCHAQGVIVLVTGTYGNVIRLLPPLVIGAELLEDGLEVLEGAIRSAQSELG